MVATLFIKKGAQNMKHTVMLMLVCAALGAWSSTAGAEPYWVSYDGTDFPENQGWTRLSGAGGADRWIEDGTLALDGRANFMIYDAYTMTRMIDPEPGELFIMRVRIKVDDIASGPWDPAFFATSDDSWSVGFALSKTRIFNVDDLSMSATFEPGVYHTYELRSWDMRNYELRIDGGVAITGPFTHIISSSRISWGDEVEGAASLSHWDYFEFGVVPEPGGAAGLAVVALIVFCHHGKDTLRRR